MVYLFLAEGFEEIEAITPIDILRRAKIDIRTVSITEDIEVMGSHNIIIKADMKIKDIEKETIDMIILPGGPGASSLEKCAELDELISYTIMNKKYIGAICAAPMILGKKGYLKGKNAICYPGYEKYLVGANIINEEVLVSDNIITSKGAGTAMDFGYKIVSLLKDKNTTEKLMKIMQYCK